MKKLIVCMTKSLAVAGIFGGVSFSNGAYTVEGCEAAEHFGSAIHAGHHEVERPFTPSDDSLGEGSVEGNLVFFRRSGHVWEASSRLGPKDLAGSGVADHPGCRVHRSCSRKG